MSETYARPAFGSYRDEVTELMEAGRPFGEVEEAIDLAPDLNEDAKAALWLLAFSLRDQCERVQAPRRQVASVG